MNPNYVYIRVSNKGCSNSSGNDQLKLYWAKANTALDWDEYWNGEVVIRNAKMGDKLGTKIILPTVTVSETILEFEW